MARKVTIDELCACISEELKGYCDSVITGIKKANDECMQEFVKDTKKHAPRGYRKIKKYYTHIASKTKVDTPNRKVNVWYVKKPEYRLTHLLKNGHMTANGKRTKPQDFITPSYEKMVAKYSQKVEEVIKNGH